MWGWGMESANLHVVQPRPLARARETLHVKIPISDNTGVRMENVGCHGGTGGGCKKLSSVSIGGFSRTITRSLGSIWGLAVH